MAGRLIGCVLAQLSLQELHCLVSGRLTSLQVLHLNCIRATYLATGIAFQTASGRLVCIWAQLSLQELQWAAWQHACQSPWGCHACATSADRDAHPRCLNHAPVLGQSWSWFVLVGEGSSCIPVNWCIARHHHHSSCLPPTFDCIWAQPIFQPRKMGCHQRNVQAWLSTLFVKLFYFVFLVAVFVP